MSNPSLRVDLSNVSTFHDLYSALAKGIGFEHCGCSNPDGLLEHLEDLNTDRNNYVQLKRGQTLRLGMFALSGLRQRNAALARQLEQLIASANTYAVDIDHGAPFIEQVSIPGPSAPF